MTPERRRAALTLAAIGLGLSLLCGWLLTDAIAAFRAGMSAGAPEVRVAGGDVAMLVLMPILIGLAAWGLLSALFEGAWVVRVGNGIAVAAMVAVPIALGGAWAFQNWAEHRLSAEGYVRCGGERPRRLPSVTLCARKQVPSPGKGVPGT